MQEHRNAVVESFTKQYDLKILVHVEPFKYVNDAIRREKQLKAWKRLWKIDLIEQANPHWLDLYEELFGPNHKSSHESSSGHGSGQN